MSFIWTVAWRLLREGRFQTALILGGVTIGVGVIVYITAIVNGLQANIIERTLCPARRMWCCARPTGSTSRR